MEGVRRYRTIRAIETEVTKLLPYQLTSDDL
jgi:hypothetical protein